MNTSYTPAASRSTSLSLDRFSASNSRRRPSSSSSSASHRPLIDNRPITLWTHQPPNFSTNEIVLSPDHSLPGLNQSTLLKVTLAPKSRVNTKQQHHSQSQTQQQQHSRDQQHHSQSQSQSQSQSHANQYLPSYRNLSKLSFVFNPAHALAPPDFAARQPNLQLSLSAGIASVFGFYNRADAILSRVPRDEHTIDHVELYFRDQYIGRADMWRFFQSLQDTCVYCGQKISLAGSVPIRATIGRIFINQKKVASGYLAPSTKAIFRSESAKYNLFIQLAREMWQFDEDGEIYYEKALQGFIPQLLKRWRSVPTNHVISIVLFTRVLYEPSELHMLEGPIRVDAKGRHYIDYYKVVVDLESNCDWTSVMTTLKEEFFRFQHDILLLRRPVSGPAARKEELHADLIRDRVHLAGRLSYSHEGNLLEAINLALNPFDEHYIDRDLHRTGLSMVFLTAGTGHFDVDKRLLRITTERMIENGTGLDLVCLTKMPLHSVPLFHFTSHYPDHRDLHPQTPTQGPVSRRAANSSSSSANPSGSGRHTLVHRQSSQRLGGGASHSTSAPPDPLYFDTKRPREQQEEDFYSMPHWIDCSFYNLQQDKPFRADRFVPRCKMYEVQMMGIMENQISDIAIPFLDLKPAAKVSSVQSSFYLPRHVTPSASAFVSEPNASAISDLALADLAPKEQRRLARERFDRQVFMDVDPTVRSILKPPPTKMIESPVTSEFQRPFERPELKRAQSSGYGKQSTPGSSLSPVKQGAPKVGPPPGVRASRLGREGSSPNAADLPQDTESSRPVSPSQARFNLRSTGTSPEDDRSIAPARSRPLSQVFPSSRPGSVRSTSTFTRGVRLLEPIGKAKPLVASTDAILSATSTPLVEDPNGENKEASTTGTGTSAIKTGQKPGLNQAGGSASLGKASSSSNKKGKGYASTAGWLWNSLTGSAPNSRPHSSSSDMASTSEAKDTLSTPAARRIQEVLASQLRSNAGGKSNRGSIGRGFNSPGILSRSSSLLSVHEAAGPAPIKIPSQLTARTRQEAEAEERIFRDQDAYEQQLEEEEARQRFAQRAQVEKQTLVNPSNPTKNLQSQTSQLLRWQHLFPRRLNHHAVKWRSMTTPACLPLTTLYLPTELDLAAMWHEHPHTTSITSETTSFMLKKSASTHPALAVLREMTFHRLAQGYQFIVPASKSTHTASSRKLNDPKHFTLRWPSELLQPGNLSTGNPIFLSMTNQIHRISYDRSAGAINVKRYVRKTNYSTDPIEYSCCVWPRHLPGYQTVEAKFHYPDSASYNWTYLDSLIAGYVDERFVESLRYWRTRFVLVPSEGSPPPIKAPTGEDLDDEEIRILGTDKLAELFHRARYAKSKEERDPTLATRFLPTSLDPAMSMHDEEFMKQLAAADELAAQRAAHQYVSGSVKKRPQKQLEGRALEAVAKDMRSGLVINDRLWNRIMYPDTFTGTDFVTWLCQEYADVRTREDAVEAGIGLMETGLFEHVHGSHGLMDGHYFYRLKGEFGEHRHGKGWFRSGKSEDGGDDARSSFGEKDGPKRPQAASLRRRASGDSADSRPAVTHSRQPSLTMTRRKKRIQLSRSMVIDVDPGRRSDRAEVAFLHHDVAHNPANGFNFQIHWLGTTARFIEDLVQNWTRTVEKYGLRLIEAPIGQIKDVTQHNPFQAPVQIELSLPPPHPSTYAHRLPANTIADQYFEYALLRRWGFVLDQEASSRYPKDVEIVYSSRPSSFEYSQFVHRSGVAFVQVLGGRDGFLWLNNRLFTTSHLRKTNVDADRVRREFSELCGNAVELERFYRQILASLFEERTHPAHSAESSGGGGSEAK